MPVLKAFRYAYKKSQELRALNFPFYALLMAAMRQADDVNTAKFKAMWPDVWDELHARYNAPGGLLDGER